MDRDITLDGALRKIWRSEPCRNEFILLQCYSVLMVFNFLIAYKGGISFNIHTSISPVRTLFKENSISKYPLKFKILVA
jgi:hypothetical protein